VQIAPDKKESDDDDDVVEGSIDKAQIRIPENQETRYKD
jgi:hypothetical protein